MAASIQEFGFKIPVLARSNGEVVDGHLRLKAAKKLDGVTGAPHILANRAQRFVLYNGHGPAYK